MSRRAARSRAPVSYQEPGSEEDLGDSDLGEESSTQEAKSTKKATPKARKPREPKKRTAAETDEGGWVTKIPKTSKAAASPKPRQRVKHSQSQMTDEETETQNVRSSQRDTQEDTPKSPPARKKGKTLPDSKLYTQMLQEGTAVKLIVTEFLKAYKSQAEKALCELTNFLIQSSGSNMLVSLTDHSSVDRDDLLHQIVKGTGTASSELGDHYPIASRQKKYKKFKSRFVEFFKKFTQALQKDPDTLYDGRLIPSLTEWLSVLSSAELRSFRHTCTLAMCELMHGLAAVAKQEQDLSDKAKRAVSGQGHGGKVSSAKITQLNNDIEQYTEHLETLGAVLDVGFNNVFVHRYRDIDVTIRTLCLESLGQWFLSYPEHFLTANCLKYTGWCLSDKAVGVRKAALDAALSVLQTGDETYVAEMQSFLVRFVPRFVQMAEDIDVHVASRAIQFVTLLLKFTKIVGEDDAPKIPEYIWDAEPAIRQAAVEFAYEDLFVPDPEEKKDDAVRNEEDLVQFLNLYRSFCPHARESHEDEAEAQEGAREGIECMVNGFWDRLPFLQEWDLIYARLTLSEKASRKQKHSSQVPDDNEQGLLIYILLAGAKRVSADKKPAKGAKAKKDKDDAEKKVEELSVFLIRHLPDLLSTFQADRGKVKALVELVRFIDLEQFVVLRKGADFVELVEVLQKIYLKQNEPALLEVVAGTLRHVCKDDHKLADKAEEVVRELATNLEERFRHLTDEKYDRDDERSYTDLLVTLSRMESLSRFMYLKNMSYDSYADAVLQRHMLEGKHEAVDLLLRLACHHVFYLRANINEKKPSKTALKEILNHNSNFLSHIQYIFNHEFAASLKLTAFLLASDVFVVFSEHLLKDTALSHLAVACPEEIKDLYVDQFREIVTRGEGVKAPEDKDEKAEWDLEQEKIAEEREEACRAACKVVIHDFAQHRKLAGLLLSLMLKYGKDVDEIVKLAMSNLRSWSLAACFTAQLEALKLVYESHEADIDKEKMEEIEAAVTELAKRFALSHTQFQAPAKTASTPWVNFFQQAVEWVMAVDVGTSRFGFLECAIEPFVTRASPYNVDAFARLWRKAEARARARKSHLLDEDGPGTASDKNWKRLEKFSSMMSKIATRKGVVSHSEKTTAPTEDDDAKSVASHGSVRSNLSVGTDDLDYKHGDDDISLRLSMSPIQASAAKGKRRLSTLSGDEEETKSSKGSVRSKRSGGRLSQKSDDEEVKSSRGSVRSQSSSRVPSSQPNGSGSKRTRGSSSSRVSSSQLSNKPSSEEEEEEASEEEVVAKEEEEEEEAKSSRGSVRSRGSRTPASQKTPSSSQKTPSSQKSNGSQRSNGSSEKRKRLSSLSGSASKR